MMHRPAQVERPGHAVDRALVDVELGDQPVQHVGRTSLSSTSSRTAGSNLRRCSSRSMAWSRFSVSVLVDLQVADPGDPERVMLDDLDVAGTGSVRCAAMTSSSGTNRYCDTARNLGSSGGTLTRANIVAPVRGSAIMTARLSDSARR